MKASVGLGMAAVVLMLAGCGQGDPPVADPPPSTTPTTPTGASSSTTAAALSPEQTVRAWVRAHNTLMVSGDSYDVDHLSSADCRTCSDVVDPIEKAIGAGGEFRGGHWSVDGLGVRHRAPSTIVFSVAISIAAGSTRQRAGDSFHAYSAEKHLLLFHLRRPGSTWRVSLIEWLS